MFIKRFIHIINIKLLFSSYDISISTTSNMKYHIIYNYKNMHKYYKQNRRNQKQNKKSNLSIFDKQIDYIFHDIFSKIQHPYHEPLTQILIYLIQIGDINSLYDTILIFVKGAIMYKNYDEAKYWIAQANVIAQKNNDSMKIINNWMWASEVQKQRGNYEYSLICLENALTYSNLCGNLLQCEIFSKIGKCFYYMGNLEQAKKYHEKSMNFEQQKKELGKYWQQNTKSQKNSDFNSEILNSMWLPLNSSFLEYYLNRDLEVPLMDRLKILKKNIKKYYNVNDSFRNIKILNTQQKLNNNTMSLFSNNDKIKDKILLSHKTQNKNINIFNTAQTVVPQINTMVNKLKNTLKIYYKTHHKQSIITH